MSEFQDNIELPNADWFMIKVGQILIEKNIPDWDKIFRLKLIYKDYLDEIG